MFLDHRGHAAVLTPLAAFVADAEQGVDDGIEEIAEEGRSCGDGEDQFDHWPRASPGFFAAFARLMKSRSLDFPMRRTPRFFFETFRGLR